MDPVAGSNICWQSLWSSLCHVFIHAAAAAVCRWTRWSCPSSCVDSGPPSYAASRCSSGYVTTGQSSNTSEFSM